MAITDNQLKGNWGEQFIASELASQGCFIRHVTQGHDCGVDLYCETIKDGVPFLHFWCQVKTSIDWADERDNHTYRTSKSELEYWLKQPVPVYIFLVPDLREKINIPYYICTPLGHDNEKINSFLKISNRSVLKNFLNDYLPVQTFVWELKEGKVSHLKTPNPEYVVYTPGGLTHQFEDKIFNSLRVTLWRLSKDILFTGQVPSKILDDNQFDVVEKKRRINQAKPYMEAFKILIEAKNDGHYENYYTLGLYHEMIENYEVSAEYFKKSLDSIYKDNNLNHFLEPWTSVIDLIKACVKRVESKNALNHK